MGYNNEGWLEPETNNLTWSVGEGKYVPIRGLSSVPNPYTTEPLSKDDIPHKPSPDFVEHPPHYQVEGVPPELEVYKVVKAYTSGLAGFEAVCQGHIIRYILRWYRKNGVEDLKKARWYLDKLIKMEEGEVDG